MFIPLYVYRHRNNHNHHCQSILHSVLSFVVHFGVVIRVEYLSSDVYGRIVASVGSALIIDVNPVSEKPPCVFGIVSNYIANLQSIVIVDIPLFGTLEQHRYNIGPPDTRINRFQIHRLLDHGIILQPAHNPHNPATNLLQLLINGKIHIGHKLHDNAFLRLDIDILR